MFILKYVDYFLDRITMYRLVLYFLILLLVIAGIFGFFGILPYSPLSLVLTTGLILVFSWLTNTIMAKIFEAPTNLESVYITALILTLIVNPITRLGDIPFIFWISVLSMSSKYILAVKKKHIFNPAAIALVLTSLAGVGTASWWVGTAVLTPFVVIGGYLIIRKLKFENMVWIYLTVAIVTALGFSVLQGGNLITSLRQIILSSSLFFLGGVMLTEPLTLPPTKNLKMIYGGIVGFLSFPLVHIGSLFFTPELALSFGNIFSYLVSPKQKLLLKLEKKIQIAPGIIDFVFKPSNQFTYSPGQYMEWTIAHAHADSRGSRRYFTLASSPTEPEIRLGVKFYENGSSYKKVMSSLNSETRVVATQLAGDFTLPKDKNKKIVFIAGGIGITPFRSMVKYLIDKNEKRNIVLFYSNKREEEIVYKEIFDTAEKEIGLKTVYTLTDQNLPFLWEGEKGRVRAQMIARYVPDYKERIFYISGPQTQIDSIKGSLKELGISSSQIKTDYFPGLT